MTVKDTDIAWAAGLFDGEGCIFICYTMPSRRLDIVNPCYKMGIKVTMGDAVAVRRFGKIAGAGSFQKHKARGERINASYSWMAMSRKAEHVLKLLRPYLVTKRAETKVALQFMKLPDGRTGGRGGSKPISRAMMQRRHDLYLQCCRLKPRCRFRKNRLSKHPSYRLAALRRQRRNRSTS